jgi:hypothetical protein
MAELRSPTVRVPFTSDVIKALMNAHPCRYCHDVSQTNIAHNTNHKEDFEYLNESHNSQTGFLAT